MTETATAPLLQIKNLRTCFTVEGGTAWAVDGVSFDIYPDETLGARVVEGNAGEFVVGVELQVEAVERQR